MIDIDVAVAADGRLHLTADEEAREEILGRLARYGFWMTLEDTLEPYYTNGSYTPFDPSNANPFVGLTDAPCIAEDLTCLDDGTQEIVGRFWYFGRYMLECPLETLAETGKVIFDQA